jgi:hypothetical protein
MNTSIIDDTKIIFTIFRLTRNINYYFNYLYINIIYIINYRLLDIRYYI